MKETDPQNNLRIDRFFSALSEGERPEAKDLDVQYLIQILVEAGANLESADLDEAKKSLAKEKYKNRRVGLVIIWGEPAIIEFEDWAQGVSVITCPKFANYGEESRSFGLKQMLGELTQVAVGDMNVEDFARRTAKRVRFGAAYPTVKKSEDPVEYQRQRGVYEALKGESELSNIPSGSLTAFWTAVRGGTLFPAE